MAGDDVSTDDDQPFGPTVAAFDETVDALFEPLRANPTLNRAMYVVTNSGDWSKIWHASGVVAALVRRRPQDVVRLSVVMGLESLIVNQGVKRLFGRVRPRRDDLEHEHDIRTPLTSSFPSGHASAAMTAAAVLSRRGGWYVWYPLGMVVAWSRVHVRMHHPSDVVAGLATGALLGRIANRVLDHLD